VLRSSGSLLNLGPSDPIDVRPKALNNAKTVVGLMQTRSRPFQFGFVYFSDSENATKHGEGFIDLKTWSEQGWLASPFDVNNENIIVGEAAGGAAAAGKAAPVRGV